MTFARQVAAGLFIAFMMLLGWADGAAAQDPNPNCNINDYYDDYYSCPPDATAPTTTVTVARTGSLARSGGDFALPLAAAGGMIALVLTGRRMAAAKVSDR